MCLYGPQLGQITKCITVTHVPWMWITVWPDPAHRAQVLPSAKHRGLVLSALSIGRSLMPSQDVPKEIILNYWTTDSGTWFFIVKRFLGSSIIDYAQWLLWSTGVILMNRFTVLLKRSNQDFFKFSHPFTIACPHPATQMLIKQQREITSKPLSETVLRKKAQNCSPRSQPQRMSES